MCRHRAIFSFQQHHSIHFMATISCMLVTPSLPYLKRGRQIKTNFLHIIQEIVLYLCKQICNGRMFMMKEEPDRHDSILYQQPSGCTRCRAPCLPLAAFLLVEEYANLNGYSGREKLPTIANPIRNPEFCLSLSSFFLPQSQQLRFAVLHTQNPSWV